MKPVVKGLARIATMTLTLSLVALPVLAAGCPAEQLQPVVTTDPALCASLESAVRHPGALPLNEYEDVLNQYLGNFCHRNEAVGWVRDKYVRDTGPFIASLQNGGWTGSYFGTHAPVVVWYSPETHDWMKQTRRGEQVPSDAPNAPEGAIIVKEMYPAPAAACSAIDPIMLKPTSGAAIMVRDTQAAYDGWFWGWYGWSGWDNDWPAKPGNRYPYMGFGQYCTNCHGSATNSKTFASLRNIQGEAGEPLVFLSQNFFNQTVLQNHHTEVSKTADDAKHVGLPPLSPATSLLTQALNIPALTVPTAETVARMPSQTYDNVWVDGPTVNASHTFLTSDQCAGCHDAGSTGLQFDMTTPAPHGKLYNESPYGLWSSSPMGLAGRDPIFFAQLASETQSFHPSDAALVQTTCLGCHGIMGERQANIDNPPLSAEACTTDFQRSTVDAVPYPPNNPSASLANFGALSRDGISCTVCHRMVLGQDDTARYQDQPQNACVNARQDLLNPDNTGFARTFTGSFLVGPPDRLFGPFEDPKTVPMHTSLGNVPEFHTTISSSEVCGTCHTVHLPVLDKGKVVGRVYEQTTYPEWAFSAYRVGTSPDGPLPEGPGARAQSCQDCHMPSKDATGAPFQSKVASIQEHSNFPQAENARGSDEIDLEVRDNYSKHNLVGLNVFLVKMAQQFPDVLGIRTQDPMLVSRGVDPLQRTEELMLDQAANTTASIAIGQVQSDAENLTVEVVVTNKTGHKFPSGVGFRRAFVEFTVLDAAGQPLWVSGQTNAAGLLVDQHGAALPGELWWTENCGERIAPNQRIHQPHYQTITNPNQVQIYQELVAAPPTDGATPHCGAEATPAGPLTTSFLSICAEVKDNRLLPDGFLPLDERIAIAQALGAGKDLAVDAGSTAVGDDPDYLPNGQGQDSLLYQIALGDLAGSPAMVKATLFYQATPPYYLQDRFCTAQGADTDRLLYLTQNLNLQTTKAADWKLEMVSTGAVPVAAP